MQRVQKALTYEMSLLHFFMRRSEDPIEYAIATFMAHFRATARKCAMKAAMACRLTCHCYFIGMLSSLMRASQ